MCGCCWRCVVGSADVDDPSVWQGLFGLQFWWSFQSQFSLDRHFHSSKAIYLVRHWWRKRVYFCIRSDWVREDLHYGRSKFGRIVWRTDATEWVIWYTTTIVFFYFWGDRATTKVCYWQNLSWNIFTRDILWLSERLNVIRTSWNQNWQRSQIFSSGLDLAKS